MAAKEIPRSALKFVVFLGTVREGNLGSRAGKFIVKKLNEKGFQVNFLGESDEECLAFHVTLWVESFMCDAWTGHAKRKSKHTLPVAYAPSSSIIQFYILIFIHRSK